ncbi:WhiB family transcriptional regulator [Streptomyces prasinopilosus]|uniref:WhiB family transcriptional regulator n=1 Tax=Streptomyces prasinopilosus TaxID=67344 RepID=UPI00099E71AC
MTITSTNTRRLTKPAAPADTGNWRDDAECRAHDDPDLWFPVGHSVGWIAQIREAKTICGQCPVRRECLEWALAAGQLNGIWGGLTEGERQELLRDRADVRARSYERCIDAQEFIERRVAEKATHRMIADELGVGRSAVSKALRFFQSERAAAGIEVVKAA